ncbi:MAG TPA: hypothetical protein VKY44_00655 [Flavobacterium sp.]|nr:hypothetical protein [Flavobacterium sp.]
MQTKDLIPRNLEELYTEEKCLPILLKISEIEKERKEEKNDFSIKIFMTKDLLTKELLLGWTVLGHY